MKYFKKILRYAQPYKGYAWMNIVSNIFYALFGTLAMVSLFPMLSVLFDNTKRRETAPTWEGLMHAKDYFEEYLNFFVTQQASEGAQDVLIFMVILVIGMFLLKNLFGYLAMYFITFLTKWSFKRFRNDLYKKTIDLPVSFYSEKRKGDTIARITSDVLEIQHSFLSILELIVSEPLTIFFAIIAMLLISAKAYPFCLYIYSYFGVNHFENRKKFKKKI